MDNFRKVHKGVNNDWVYANRKSTPRSMRRDTGRNGINNTKITPAEIQLIIKLHDNDQKSFMQIGKILNRSSEKVRKEYIKNATFTEDGFYASSKWCSGCMYFGSLGSTPCCDYTYLTGHAKKREGEPACTCRYKTIGKRPKVEEE